MKTIIGQENIVKLLWDILEENSSGKLRSILTGKPLVYYFGEDFAEKFMQRRVQKGIILQSLRLTMQNYDEEGHKNYQGYLKEVQHVSYKKEISPDVIFLQDDTVILFFISSMEAKVCKGGEEYRRYDQLFTQNWD